MRKLPQGPRHVFVALLAVPLLLAGCSTAAPATTSPEAATTAAAGITVPTDVSKAGALDVAVYLQYPPYSYTDAANQPAGVEIELIKAVAAKLDVRANFHSVAFDAIIPGIQNGRYDFAAGTFFDVPERTTQVDILDFMRSTSRMVVPTGNPDKVDPADPCGVAFANAVGGFQIQQVEAMGPVCEAKGEPAPTQIQLPDTASQFQALLTGRAQAVLIDPGVGAYLAKQQNDQLQVLQQDVTGVDVVEAGWVFPKEGSDELEVAVVTAIQQLIAEGKWKQILDTSDLSSLMIDPPTINSEPVTS